MKKSTKKIYQKVSLIFLGILLQSLFTYVYHDYISSQEEKKEKIAYIDKQLIEFYIPLKNKLDKSKRLFVNYKKQYLSEKDIKKIIHKESPKESVRWQRYMLSVFQPIHIEISNLLSSKRYLMDSNIKVTNQLSILEQHITYYKIIFMQWKDNDVSSNFAPTKFPGSLASLIRIEIERLEIEKIRLKAE